MKSLCRVALVLPCLASLPLPAEAQDPPARYVRTEGGVAVEVPWFAARVGRALRGGALAVDAGVGGSLTGRGYLSLTGGLEARFRSEKRVSPFARLEVGFMSQSQGQSYGVVSLGAGLSFRLDRSWSARVGLMRSLQIEDSVSGPDWVFVGMEYRW
jgi:hypothetical protein